MNIFNLEKWRKGFVLSASFVFILTLVYSCKKKETIIGKSEINGEEYLNSVKVDTFTLNTYTIFEDSVETGSSYYNFLGSYNDPVFGQVDAGFYTQLRLSGLNPNFGDISQIVVDSVVLGLQYATSSPFYGSLDQQKVEVYEINEDFHKDSSYFAFSELDIKSQNLVISGTENFTPDPLNQTVIDTIKVPAQLRIKIENSFAESLINRTKTNSSDFTSQENFLNYFKGFYIKVNNPVQTFGKGAILTFDTKTSLSKLTIYYKSNGIKKTYDLLINNESLDFNKVTITRSPSSQVQNVLDNKNEGNKAFYAQAFGLKAKVEIPGLNNLSKRIIVHKAYLNLPYKYQTGTKYEPGSNVSLQRDYEYNSPFKVNYATKGYLDYTVKSYFIDARVYVQDVVSGTIDNTGIYVFPSNFTESFNRIIFNGSNTTYKNKPKLTLIYTEF